MREAKVVKVHRAKIIICAVVCALLTAVIVVGNILGNAYAGTIDDYMGWNSGGKLIRPGGDPLVTVTDDWADIEDEALSFNSEIGDEGIVLLKNKNALPLLQNAKINMFGAGSVNLQYGGKGSGATPNQYTKTDGSVIKLTAPRESLEKAGFSINSVLYEYTLQKESPNISGGTGGEYTEDNHYTGIEIPAGDFNNLSKYNISGRTLLQQCMDYSDIALIVLSRSGSENYQMTEDYLKLTQNETDMLNMLKDNFRTVIAVLNTSNAMEAKILDNDSIGAVIWIGNPGLKGIEGMGKIISGAVNPSGRMCSTWAYELASAPAAQNTEKKFNYNNFTDWPYTSYSEGIYVGYRWYTTAASEGFLDFGKTVQYPFGYGLSYTEFSWSASELEVDNSGGITEFFIDITVKNEGTVSGKDVVQVYCNPPYTSGGIEKSYVVLTAFAKTCELDAGEEQTLTLNWNAYDFASYDQKDGKNGSGRYIAEKGTYNFFIMPDCYSVNSAKTIAKQFILDEDAVISKDPLTGTDVKNRFEDAGNYGNITYLSRAGGFANYNAITCGGLINISDHYKAQTSLSYGVSNDSSLPAPNPPAATSKINGLELIDLRGLDYADAAWELFLDQISAFDMIDLISDGGYTTKSIAALNIPATKSTDGPNGISSTFSAVKISGIAMPSETVIASAWNTVIANKVGFYIAKQCFSMGFQAWEGPGMNVHRSSGLCGRNYEYYSEDSHLGGSIGASVVKGAQDLGLVCHVKHFALNDQETARNGIIEWCSEQALREIYLKQFEYAVKRGGATGIMTAFNRIGCEWVGASSALLENVLRGEWGFRGIVYSDYSTGDYMNGAQGIRAGQDKWMSGNSPKASLRKDYRENPNSSVYYLRRAVKNICYAHTNSDFVMSGIQPGAVYSDVVSGTFIALVWMNVVLGAGIAVCLFFIIRYLLPVIIKQIKFKEKKNEKNK